MLILNALLIKNHNTNLTNFKIHPAEQQIQHRYMEKRIKQTTCHLSE